MIVYHNACVICMIWSYLTNMLELKKLALGSKVYKK